jgi:hypothetical protein
MKTLATIILMSFLTACSGSDGGANAVGITTQGPDIVSGATYTLNVNVAGMTGTALDGVIVLQNNGGDDLWLGSNGAFAFNTTIEYGSAYNVTILVQTSTARVCTVQNGRGTASGANVSVSVVCGSDGWNFTIGGTATGLSEPVILREHSSYAPGLLNNDLIVTKDGPFTFTTTVGDGNSYEVEVWTKSLYQECVIENGTGTVESHDVQDILLTCVKK